jgi:hypothetical protein
MAITDQNDSSEEILERVPEEHRDFARNILARHDVDTADLYSRQFVTRNYSLDPI